MRKILGGVIVILFFLQILYTATTLTVLADDNTLELQLIALPNPTRDVEGATIVARVTSNGQPVEGASVTISYDNPSSFNGFEDDGDPSTPLVSEISGITNELGEFQAWWGYYGICLAFEETILFHATASKEGYISASDSYTLTVKPFSEIPFPEPSYGQITLSFPSGPHRVYTTLRMPSRKVFKSEEKLYLEIEIGRTIDYDKLDFNGVWMIPVFKNTAGFISEASWVTVSLPNTATVQAEVIEDEISIEAHYGLPGTEEGWMPISTFQDMNKFIEMVSYLKKLHAIAHANWIGFTAGFIPGAIQTLATRAYGQNLGHGPEGPAFDPNNNEVKIFALSFGVGSWGVDGFKIKLPIKVEGNGPFDINIHVAFPFVNHNQYVLNYVGAQFEPLSYTVVPSSTQFYITAKSHKSFYQPGEKSKVTLNVLNLETSSIKFQLGVSFKDSLGKVYDIPFENLPSATLMSEESKRFVIEWQIPTSAPEGTYQIAVNCWKDQTTRYQDNLEWEDIFVVAKFRPVDLILVIDRSGSMTGSMGGKTKIQGAKEAAIAVIDSLLPIDRVAVVSFSSYGTVNVHLTSDFEYAKKEINKISAWGSTSFGAGLSLAINELKTRGNPEHAWAIIFMSNGWHNTAPAPQSYVSQCKDLGIPIYTVGLGSSSYYVNEALLKWMSEQTGGTYLFAPSLDELQNIFIRFELESAGWSPVEEFTGTVGEGQTVTAGTFTVNQGTTFIRASLNWPGSNLDLILLQPDGSQLDFEAANVIYSGPDSKPEWVIISEPQAGAWTVQVYGRSIDSPDEQFIIWVSSYTPPRPVLLTTVNPTSITTEPGQAVTYEVTIQNGGNIEDTYHILVENFELDQSWLILSSSSITLEPNQTGTIELIISVPHQSIVLKSYTFIVKVVSTRYPDIYTTDYVTLSLSFNPILPELAEGGLAIAITPKFVMVPAGTELTLNIKLLNNENFDDVIELNVNLNGIPSSYQTNLSWFSWTSVQVFVPKGSSITIQLTLKIPVTVPTEYKFFKIEASSITWTRGYARDSGIIYVQR